jgi:hypothetical protein
MKAQHLNIDALRAELVYNHETGEVRSRHGKARQAKTPLGYMRIFWRNQFLRCHRVAWAIHYNEQPPEVIDHINGVGTDNRIENLRAATFSQNKQNSRRYKNNKSGAHGVYWLAKEKRWVATISREGKTHSLGRFHSREEAIESRRIGEARFFGEFTSSHS